MPSKLISRFLAVAAAAGVSAGAQAQTTLDLTTKGAEDSFNGATFVQIPNGSTGTGVIDPFLTIKRNSSEQGFNTDAKKQLDNLRTGDSEDGGFTRSLLTSALPVVTRSGGSFFELLLDINEAGNDPLLYLNSIKIYQTTNPALTNADREQLTPIWDLDSNGDGRLKLDYSLNAGSGYGDIFAYIPTAGFDLNKYFVLYSQFGSANNSIGASDAGFEEWAIRTQVPAAPVPEPSTYALMVAGLAAVGFVARRRKTTGA